MSRCWTCGSDYAGGTFGHFFTCPLCSSDKQLRSIRENLEHLQATSIKEAMESVMIGVETRLAEIASIIEWGFEEIHWRLDVVSGTLKSIDATLKSPSATQANEWRQFGEELRRRGVLDESESFYLKSLETNPLDYRTYIGLGKTYLQMQKLDKARVYWEKSLPHAPKDNQIDYRSYSYRLIGRTYFCEDNIQQAASSLSTAVEISPYDYLAHYDLAQYLALLGKKEDCIWNCYIALIRQAVPFELAKKERNLQYCEGINGALSILESVESRRLNLDSEVKRIVEQKWKMELEDLNSDLQELRSMVSKTKENVKKTKESFLRSRNNYANKYSLPVETVDNRWPYYYIDWICKLADVGLTKAIEQFNYGIKELKTANVKQARYEFEKAKRKSRSLLQRFLYKQDVINELKYKRNDYLDSLKPFYHRGYNVYFNCEAVNIYSSICLDVLHMSKQD